jgi:hypothetical protein
MMSRLDTDICRRFQEDLRVASHKKYGNISGITVSEKAIKHVYNAANEMWDKILINVIVQDAFAEGSMRTAHYMRDLSESGDQKFVLKLSKDGPHDAQVMRTCTQISLPSTSTVIYTHEFYCRQACFEDVRMQMVAKRFADLYNSRGPPKRVDFLAAYVLELIDRPGR